MLLYAINTAQYNTLFSLYNKQNSQQVVRLTVYRRLKVKLRIVRKWQTKHFLLEEATPGKIISFCLFR
jgi:hypothetical protein